MSGAWKTSGSTNRFVSRGCKTDFRLGYDAGPVLRRLRYLFAYQEHKFERSGVGPRRSACGAGTSRVSTRSYGMDRRSFLSLVAGCITWSSIAYAVSRPPIALRRLRLVNTHTGETFDGAYRDDKGPIEGSS